jgi:hypothetical protein
MEDFMRQKSFVRTFAMFVAGSSFLAVHGLAQDPGQPSIADAARQSRAQKKAPPKAAPIITDDTLHPASSQPASSTAVPPQSPAPGSESASPASSAPAADVPSNSTAVAPEVNPAESEKVKVELAALKQLFKDKQDEVDLLQRLLTLDRDALQSKPDYSRDADGKAKLDSEANELLLKKDELAQLKTKLQSMLQEDPSKPETSKP